MSSTSESIKSTANTALVPVSQALVSLPSETQRKNHIAITTRLTELSAKYRAIKERGPAPKETHPFADRYFTLLEGKDITSRNVTLENVQLHQLLRSLEKVSKLSTISSPESKSQILDFYRDYRELVKGYQGTADSLAKEAVLLTNLGVILNSLYAIRKTQKQEFTEGLELLYKFLRYNFLERKLVGIESTQTILSGYYEYCNDNSVVLNADPEIPRFFTEFVRSEQTARKTSRLSLWKIAFVGFGVAAALFGGVASAAHFNGGASAVASSNFSSLFPVCSSSNFPSIFPSNSDPDFRNFVNYYEPVRREEIPAAVPETGEEVSSAASTVVAPEEVSVEDEEFAEEETREEGLVEADRWTGGYIRNADGTITLPTEEPSTLQALFGAGLTGLAALFLGRVQ